MNWPHLKSETDPLWLVLGFHTQQLILSASVWRAGTVTAGGGFSTLSCSPVDHRHLRRGSSAGITDGLGTKSNVTISDFVFQLYYYYYFERSLSRCHGFLLFSCEHPLVFS